MIMMDQVDILNLALCAWKEARNQGPQGCIAVMHVIINRVGAPGFGHTLHDVIYGRNQFTSMSVPSDPEYNLSPPPKGFNSHLPTPDEQVYHVCLSEAQAIAAGNATFDVTNGAHYYADLETEHSGWFERNICGPDGKGMPGHEFTVKIGQHSFYK